MAVNPNYTNVNEATTFYSTGGGGGGGGTTSTFNTLSASSLTISSMNGLIGPGGVININSGLNMTTGGIVMGLEPIFWSAGAPGDTLAWTGNDGQIAGVSTINGVAYPPPSTGGGCFQLGSLGTINLTGGTGGAVTNATASFTTVVGDYYRASICFVYTPVSGSPAGNAFLFFQTTSDVAQVVHIPLSSITPNIPFEMILFFKGTVTTTAIQVGLNDSGASQCNLSISTVSAAPVAILEKLGAPQVLT